MEIFVLFTPLTFGPFIFFYGLGQVSMARFQYRRGRIPYARVALDQEEEPKGSWRRRGRQNLALGGALSIGLLLVFLALVESATS